MIYCWRAQSRVPHFPESAPSHLLERIATSVELEEVRRRETVVVCVGTVQGQLLLVMVLEINPRQTW